MSDDSRLLSEIAELAGAINRHRNSQQGYHAPPPRVYKARQNTWTPPGSNTWTSKTNKAATPTRTTTPSTTAATENTSNTAVTPSFAQPTPTYQKPAYTKYQKSHYTNHHTNQHHHHHHHHHRQPRSINKPCIHFTRTGTCSNGLSCPYNHDAHHVAICKPWLKGKCTRPDCSMSHVPTAHNAPLCIHYLHGSCTRDDCKYTHQDVAQDASICRAFALNGYCELGPMCKQKHVFECPDFQATGTCPRPNCTLQHVLRAKKSAEVVDVDIGSDNNLSHQRQTDVDEAVDVGQSLLAQSPEETDQEEQDMDDFQTKYNNRNIQAPTQQSGADYIELQ